MPSTCPRASSARTATRAARVRAVIAVSNPSLAFEATPRSREDDPASTCQRATSVAPFQLAYTTTRRPRVRRAAIAGDVAGRPVHGARSAR